MIQPIVESLRVFAQSMLSKNDALLRHARRDPKIRAAAAGNGFRFASLRFPKVLVMRNPSPLHPVAAQSLALALIASSNAPVLLLDGGLSIVAASESFCRTFDIDPAKTAGRTLSELGDGEWSARQLLSLLETTLVGNAGIDAYEMDLKRPGRSPRRLVVNAQKLDYADADNVRILLAVSDVTEAKIGQRLKDDTLRENGILLQELQHRVANSLQIVASVLMQNARLVQSEETRGHLHDAHHRVMSVAEVQRHLTSSGTGDVALRVYFRDLCRSIGASMIRDHNQLSLEVAVDESVATADVSVSLGLIVTELVINALKHAFPGHRQGKIKVGYKSLGKDWTLSVDDDGVGMKAGQIKTGLGTSIIEALAKKLDADVVVTDAKPGTKVSVVHATGAAAEKPDEAPLEAV